MVIKCDKLQNIPPECGKREPWRSPEVFYIVTLPPALQPALRHNQERR